MTRILLVLLALMMLFLTGGDLALAANYACDSNASVAAPCDFDERAPLSIGSNTGEAEPVSGDRSAKRQSAPSCVDPFGSSNLTGQVVAARGGVSAAEGLIPAGLRYSKHAVGQMGERGVTQRMVDLALEKGTPYWDPKNKVVNYVLEGGFGSGKDLLVGQNPASGIITTVIRGWDLVAPRFIPWLP